LDGAESTNLRTGPALDAAIRKAMARDPDGRHTSARELAVELKVNANTIGRVYSELERAGVFETRRGVGTFVLADRAEARPASEHARRLRAFATRVLSDGDAHGFSAEEVIGALRAHRSMK